MCIHEHVCNNETYIVVSYPILNGGGTFNICSFYHVCSNIVYNHVHFRCSYAQSIVSQDDELSLVSSQDDELSLVLR